MLLITGFCFIKINAQNNLAPSAACPTPFGCGNDLRDSIFHLSDIDKLTETYGKVPIDAKFHDVLYGHGQGDCTTSAMFYTQPMLNQVYPGINNSAILGGVDKNFYYGESTITYNIKGFMDMWGGLSIPPNPTYLDSPELFFNQTIASIPPMISFQGHMDPVFADTFKVVYFANTSSQNLPYHSENHCLLSKKDTFFLHPKGPGKADSYLLGEIRIDSMLRKLCKPSEYYLDSQMMHGLDTTSNPALYHSDFGTGATDALTTLIYMVQRAGTFCQAVLNNKAASLITTRFFECENYRHGCAAADDNAGCPVNPGPLICH